MKLKFDIRLVFSRKIKTVNIIIQNICKNYTKWSADNCYPHVMWAGTRTSSGSYYGGRILDGSYVSNSWPGTVAFSVRASLFA